MRKTLLHSQNDISLMYQINPTLVNIYSIMRPGEVISTNDVLRMYESEK